MPRLARVSDDCAAMVLKSQLWGCPLGPCCGIPKPPLDLSEKCGRADQPWWEGEGMMGRTLWVCLLWHGSIAGTRGASFLVSKVMDVPNPFLSPGNGTLPLAQVLCLLFTHASSSWKQRGLGHAPRKRGVSGTQAGFFQHP